MCICCYPTSNSDTYMVAVRYCHHILAITFHYRLTALAHERWLSCMHESLGVKKSSA